ncbi:hypothetical protein [Hymenobacter rigui]|uniref:DUF4142 domain-containing protein n=1 Tax=Hymenobacter rigui TaxID=334424 RepID=A0A3R9PFC9_9BACT|nr:hypothetical protein [Hymenobacter rigui]RSK50865.1 hypothetical protein EI291_00665 [Hymenobacter rigui]
MKICIIRVVLLLSLCSTAFRGMAQTASTDTLVEKKMVQRISAGMCTQLQQEDKKKPLASLNKDEATQLFTRLMMASAATEPELMARITNDPAGARAYGEQLGRKIGMQLVQECEVSRPLFASMSGQGSTQFKPAGTDETKLVNTLATEFCANITPRQKELKGLPKEKRLKMVSDQLETSFKAHSKEIQQVYGADAMNDSDKLRALGSKVGYQSAQQCPAIMQILMDTK